MRKRKMSEWMKYMQWLCAILFGVFLCGMTSYAYDGGVTVYPTNVSTPSAGNMFVGIRGSYAGDEQAALDRINEIRYEACKEGVKDPRNESRNLTLSDYKPIKWSKGLEQIARIRAAEARLVVSHTRPNGAGAFTISASGISNSGEVLAWNYNGSLVSGIEQWYEEKAAWVNQTAGEVTGHYTAMINPDNTYVGVGAMKSIGVYGATIAGRFSDSSASLDESMGTAVEDCIQLIEIAKTAVGAATLERQEGATENALYAGKTIGYGVYVETTLQDGTNYKSKALIMDDISWSSSDTSVATVDQNGVVKALHYGTTTIKAESASGFTATKELTVLCAHDFTIVNSTDGKSATRSCKTCGQTDTFTVLTSFRPYWRKNISTGYFYGNVDCACVEGDYIEYYLPDNAYVPSTAQNIEITVESSDENVATVKASGSDRGTISIVGVGSTEIRMYPTYNPAVVKKITLTVTHEYGDPVITKEPTYDERGEITRICKNCNEKSIEYIDALGHTDGLDKPDPADTADKTQPSGQPVPQEPVSTTQQNGNVTADMALPSQGTTVSIGNDAYRVIGDGKELQVAYVKSTDKKSKAITVPATVLVNGVSCKVTAITKDAFKSCKKVTKIMLPDTVNEIGKATFKGCSRLKVIVIKSKLLNENNLSNGVFKGVSAKVVIKVPKDKVKEYRKLFRKKGLNKKVKVTKI